MWQMLREAYLKILCGRDVAPIQVKLPDGTIKLAKNSEQAIQWLTEAK
jgi:hypothetical protein